MHGVLLNLSGVANLNWLLSSTEMEPYLLLHALDWATLIFDGTSDEEILAGLMQLLIGLN